ncbi:MAG: hypothetical protein ABEJ60_08465 [Halodesulfurarchaeum sp.]
MAVARGQSETLGFALILGLTLISVGALAALGGATLETTQQQLGVQNAEHAMGQFDARATMVALGRSDTQQVELGATLEGTYTVDPDAGSLRIVHEQTGTNVTTVIYEGALGAIRYRNDGTEIAYQGGGIWRQDGSSMMLSPPAVHYRGSTLTLSVLQIRGEERVAANPVATIQQAGQPRLVFPNTSATFTNTSIHWVNPIEGGTVTITVQSDYYRAWAEYFRTQTAGMAGSVTVDPATETVSIELIAPETVGDFAMPLDGNSITVSGLRGHRLENFSLTLFHDQSDNAKFSNLDWSICAQSGSQEFELRVTPETNTKDGEPAKLLVYYSPDGTTYQTWKTTAFRFQTEAASEADWNGDGDYEDKRLVLDLTANATVEYYEEDNVNSISNCGFDASDFQESVTFEEHPADGNRTYTSGSSATLSHVTNHYLALLGPSVELRVADSQQNTVEEEISSGYIDFDTTGGYYLTYLHVTEAPINVTIR